LKRPRRALRFDALKRRLPFVIFSCFIHCRAGRAHRLDLETKTRAVRSLFYHRVELAVPSTVSGKMGFTSNEEKA